jgi:hypothetical protein
MGVTVSSVKKLVDGSRRVNQAVLAFTTSATNGDTLAPEAVGLHSIEGVKAVAASSTDHNVNLFYDATNKKIQCLYNNATTAVTVTVTAEFVGW